MADTVFSFGMHAGKSFQHVFDNDKWYVTWAMKQEEAGAIKCKSGLLMRFVEFCRANGAVTENSKCDIPSSSGGSCSVPNTPWSQQATQADYMKSSQTNVVMAGLPQPRMVATPMASQFHAAQHPTMMQQQQMQYMPQMLPNGQSMVPQFAVAAPPGCPGASPGGAMAQYEEKQEDPTWRRVLDHLQERGIEFETVRDAHHDTRRDILKAVFFGDPILRAAAETQWLRLRQEKNNQQRQRSRSRGSSRKMNFRPCSISTALGMGASAA